MPSPAKTDRKYAYCSWPACWTKKAKMLTQASGQVNENMLLAMVGLLLADELTELRKGNPAAATPNADNRQRILEIDRVTAEALDKIAAEINSVAKQIESL